MANISFFTNLVSLFILFLSYLSPAYNAFLFSIGLFAFSGGITNWLAIHMLFEKIPFLYGSGVVPNRFEDFKKGIKNLLIQEFFNHEHIERFFKEGSKSLSKENLTSKINFDAVFEGLVKAIEESPMGGLLSMIGGKSSLAPLKEPVINKLKDMIEELLDENESKEMKSSITQALVEKVEQIIDSRLEELTPQMVKKIIQDMIHKHLGWLVVWGGVFGGLIGLVSALLS